MSNSVANSKNAPTNHLWPGFIALIRSLFSFAVLVALVGGGVGLNLVTAKAASPSVFVTAEKTVLTLNASLTSDGTIIEVSGKLATSAGRGLGGKTIIFLVKGHGQASLTTDSSGRYSARLQLSTKQTGALSITATFNGDSSYSKASVTANTGATQPPTSPIKTTVNAQLNTTSITAGEAAVVTVTGSVKTSDGAAVPSGEVKVTNSLDNSVWASGSVSNGVFSIDLGFGENLPAGSGTIYVNFGGSGVYEPSSNQLKISVSPATTPTASPTVSESAKSQTSEASANSSEGISGADHKPSGTVIGSKKNPSSGLGVAVWLVPLAIVIAGVATFLVLGPILKVKRNDLENLPTTKLIEARPKKQR